MRRRKLMRPCAARSRRRAPCAAGAARRRPRSCVAGSPCTRPASWSVDAEVIPPHVLEDRRAGEHLARVAQEHLEQQELGAGERQRALAAPRLVREQIEAQILERERRLLFVLGARAPQQRAHAREQLAQRERLDEVVVGARVEPGDAVVDLLARGEHQHGRAVAAFAQPPAHLEPVHVRHRRRRGSPPRYGVAASRSSASRAVHRLRDLVALQRERARQRALHGGLVVDDEYACLLGHDHLRCPVCAAAPTGG